MQKPRLISHGFIVLLLCLTTFGNASIVAQAGNDHDELKADPRLLQMAAENPDAVFMVIVQKEAKNKDLKDMEVEDEVLKGGGQVKKQLDIIVSFSAEMTGKEIEKLAKNPKVRWISADAPMVSTAAGDPAPFKAVVTNAPLAVVGTVYTVTNANNSGAGSLRQAITDANARAGADTIAFNISGTGVHTITPTSALPTITGTVILDATTDNSFTAAGNKPAIRIDGASAGSGVDGLKLADGSDGSTIQGLMITKFSRDGIYIASGADNIKITGNWIGTTGTGSTGVGNTNTGIESFAIGTTIGGTGTYDGNVVTNSGNDGISLSSIGVAGYVIQGNIIGLDPDGATGGGNVDVGLAILSGTGNTIGGTTAAARNVISKNYEGIEINTANNTIQGNYIGTDKSGTLNRGNRIGDGVQIQGTANNTIVGGTVAGAGNLIAYNALRGVAILAGTGHQVLGNSIYSNTGLGIDLGTTGITTNNGTVGTGANNGIDYPIITATALGGGWLNVIGYVGSAVNQSTFSNARVEFFKAAADSSNYGEGQIFLGYLTTDASGNFSGSLPCNVLTSGDKLTATATDSNNNTSEFGPNVQVTVTPFSVFRQTIRADQLSLTGSGVTIAVVDSGLSTNNDDFKSGGTTRIIAEQSFGNQGSTADLYGHGTHVAGIIGGNGTASSGLYKGVAPQVNLVNLRVSDKDGMTYESSVIDSLQWVYNNKGTYNIRAVNISMNSTIAQSYHTSALDAAVEILWFNGIVVVVSAGNNGTGMGPVTLYPPANDPFVITVGATEDKGTVSLGDDTLAVFSAYGITENGFAKPELVAPGRNLIAPLSDKASTVFLDHPLHRVGDYYFRMSGTSMSAPVVTGTVALLLQDEPGLTPDQVKYRLMSTANKNKSTYSASQSGAGDLDIYAAVYGTSTLTANTGILASQMLSTGSTPITWGSVGWNSVGWNSVGWNSVGWNSVGWNSVGWNSVGWNSTLWEDD